MGLKMEKSNNKNNNRVQINLDKEDARLYQKIRHKKSFFSAMLNMAYKNPIYRDMFFDTQDEAIQFVSENENIKSTQKKKISVSSW